MQKPSEHERCPKPMEHERGDSCRRFEGKQQQERQRGVFAEIRVGTDDALEGRLIPGTDSHTQAAAQAHDLQGQTDQYQPEQSTIKQGEIERHEIPPGIEFSESGEYTCVLDFDAVFRSKGFPMAKAKVLSFVSFLVSVLASSPFLFVDRAYAEDGPIAIAIHGGAGTISRDAMTDEREAAIRGQLKRAVEAGHAVLSEGGSSLDAVAIAIRLLEDAPEFNAGRGAVLTEEGRVEMDASIMDGATLAAGAVASVTGIRHPIDAARHVMDDSPHVMLIGNGAEAFARQFDLEFMPEDWFITDFRREQLERIQSRIQSEETAQTERRLPWYSTVGAVAVDQNGNLAAATSTGGMSNKRWGRVGDSPIIGAGTYANNRSCAVSATGHGEYFIRHVVAYDICARMAYTARPLAQTADAVVNQVLKSAGGDGGVIAIDRFGRIAMPFNTPGMYRAAIYRDGALEVSIYRDEGRDHNQGAAGH